MNTVTRAATNTATQSHEVQRGETLTRIAAEHGVSAEALMRANGMNPALADGRFSPHNHSDPDRLQVGQHLLIPVATAGLERDHHVAAGETLAGIAEHWGVSLKDLLAVNPQFDAAKLGNHHSGRRGQDPDRLRIGDLIHRPGHNPAPTSDTTARAGVNAAIRTGAQQAAAPLAGHAQASLDLNRFTDPSLGSNAAAAIVIGSAEGTRRPDGGFNRAYGGHADPGNAANNRGSFSYQHAASSPADADRRQLAELRSHLPAYEAAARRAGLDPNNARLASAYLDLYNQSPLAAGRFLDQIGTLRGQPIDTAHLTTLRVNSFVNPATGQRFTLPDGRLAGGGFVNIANRQVHGTATEAQVQAVIRADQRRRTDAVESALSRQGLLNGSASAPAAAATTAAASDKASRILTIARGEIGTKEIRGAQDNPRVLAYHQATSLKARNDETSWCSAFVNWTMQQAGVTGTNSAAARSWLNWGTSVPKDAAHVKPGDVIVFPRGNNPAQGHVAIVEAVLADGRVQVVGGNQGNGPGQPDGVNERVRSLSEALGVRRAP